MEYTKEKNFIYKDGNYTKERLEKNNPRFLVVSIVKTPLFSSSGDARTKYKVVLKYKPTKENYEKLLVEAIREKYSPNDELAILRKAQANVRMDEFTAYNEFVESKKQEIKDAIGYTGEETNGD